MRIKTIKGHLTPTEKQAIKAILNQKLMSGRVGRKDYYLIKENDVYTVSVAEMDRGMIGWIGNPKQLTTRKKQFTIIESGKNRAG